jgi:hypothetical protein
MARAKSKAPLVEDEIASVSRAQSSTLSAWKPRIVRPPSAFIG